MATITGSSSFDVLDGTSGDDHIIGLAGADTLRGLAGSDWLEGGDGNDSLIDGAGDDLAEGGEGDDYFINSDGSDTLRGGGGDDLFDVQRGSGQSDVVTIAGGLGRDQILIRSIGPANFIVDAGDGDDFIRIDTYKGDHVLTLGAGVDTVSVASPLYFNASLSTTITDFAAGPGGDRLDFNEFFAANVPSWDGDQNPFALGFLRLVQSGADVVIEVDQDGGGNGYVEYIRLSNLSVAALTYHNLDGFPSDGSIPGGLTLDGTAGRDSLVGAAGPDSIAGLGDNDVLYGGAGADTIRGGDGNDELYGEGGNDLLEGGAGSDRLYDGFGDDVVRGGADGDTIISDGRGNDLLQGEGGDDFIDVRRGLDYQVTVEGGDGNDFMVVTAYNQANVFTVSGGAGNDTINMFSMAGTANISLGAGSDEISLAWADFSTLFTGRFIVSDFETGAGGDRLDYDQWLGLVTNWDQATNPFHTGHLRLVQSGADTLLQIDANGGGDDLRTLMTFTGVAASAFTPYNLDGFAADGSPPPGLNLIGTSAGETLTGGAGDDIIEGRGGFDSLNGMAGADLIIGGNQNDSLYGGSGDDHLEGGGGQDLLDGGIGADLIYAGDGNDSVIINSGADTVWGGAGDDNISVQTSPPLGETITVNGEGGGDTIRLLGSNPGSFIVADGGSGNDVIEMGDLAGSVTVTLGSGSDRIWLYGNAGAGTYPPGDVRITDFVAGAGGDWIDLAASLGLMLVNWDGSNPFVSGHVRLIQQGNDTLLRIDRDGSGTGYGFVTTLTLSNVSAAALTESNLGFRPHLLVGPGGFGTIQAAIDAAQDGETIRIVAGTYVENVNVSKSVTIVGPNEGVRGSATRGAEASISGTVTISADGVTLDGIKAVGGYHAIEVAADDFTLINTVFDGAGDDAVHSHDDVTGLDISRNLFKGYFHGIVVDGSNTSGAIHDNRFQDYSGSSALRNGVLSASSQLAITNNVFDFISSSLAYFLAPKGPGTVDLNSFVSGNAIFSGDLITGVAPAILVVPTGETRDIVGTDLSEWFDGAMGQSLYGAGGQTLSFDGRGGNDHIVGGDQRDTLNGGNGDDYIDGGAGGDVMIGGIGNDIFVVDDVGDVVVEAAGGGIDRIVTSLAVRSLVGTQIENLTALNNINHDFRGNSGNNVITGGGGNDFIRAYDGGDDTILAGAGQDNIFMGGSLNGADIVNGGADADTLILQGNYAGGLVLSANVTQIEGISILGGGNTNFGDPGTNLYDYVITTNDANFAAGLQVRVNGAALLAGEDFTFDGSAETDAKFVVYGGRGVDKLTGGLGNDIFFFAEDRFATGDVVNGGPGYDGMFLRGNYTIDFNAPGYTGLFTSIENLTLTSATDERYARGGGTEFDYNITLSDAIVKAGETLTVSGTILMASETMILDASQESDGLLRLFGGKADDTLKGGGQADLIHGNLGADILAGNGGADTFRYDYITESNSATLDHILDFTAGIDKLDLTRVDADSLTAGDQAFSWIGSNAFSHTAGELRAFQSGGDWFVEGDVNGDGVGDLVIQLTVQGPTPLGAGDFLL